MRKERMGVGMGVNLLLLLAMVAANILSFYHLSSTRSLSPSSLPSPHHPHAPDHLLHQLHTIQATITRLHQSTSSSSSSSPTATKQLKKSPPPELLLYSQLSPIASACSDHPDLLHRYMNYTPFSPCPRDLFSLQEPLLLRGCHPLPRRRCFSPTPSKFPKSSSSSNTNNNNNNHFFPSSLPDSAVLWPVTSSCRSFSCFSPNLGFDMAVESQRFLSSKSPLDLSLPQLLTIARAAPIKLAIDVGGGTGTLAARLKLMANATVLTTTMNLGAPYSEAAALRGLVPLHSPLQQRFPVPDAAVDLVRTGHAVNRWIPAAALEFLLFDADRVLRGGGLLWVDHFFCKAGDLQEVYAPMIGRLGYKIIKWAVGNKTDAGGVKYGEVYLTALLQKPARL